MCLDIAYLSNASEGQSALCEYQNAMVPNWDKRHDDAQETVLQQCKLFTYFIPTFLSSHFPGISNQKVP